MCLQQVVVVWFYCQDVASGGKVCKVMMRKGGRKGSHEKAGGSYCISIIISFTFHHFYKVLVTELGKLYLG